MKADSQLAIGLLLVKVCRNMALTIMQDPHLTKPRLCLPAFVAHILLEDICEGMLEI